MSPGRRSVNPNPRRPANHSGESRTDMSSRKFMITLTVFSYLFATVLGAQLTIAYLTLAGGR